MRRLAKLGFVPTALIILSACHDAAGTPADLAPMAALLVNGAENPWVAAGASMAGERVDRLYTTGELSDAVLGEGLVQRYTEIWAAYENSITPAQALGNID